MKSERTGHFKWKRRIFCGQYDCISDKRIKKKDLREAGPSLGEDKVFLYLSQYRSPGGYHVLRYSCSISTFFLLIQKSFEKYEYMSYTMYARVICANFLILKDG